jgi:FkbM family methyltransferase
MIVKSNWVTGHYMRDFVPIRKDSIVIDVGAHIGSFSILAATIARRVLAFEPEPSNYEMLKKNRALNRLENLSLFEMAVSGSDGYQALSVYEASSTGNHSLYSMASKKMVERNVETISLKEIMKREGLLRVDFLKLDCEGAEHDILKKMGSETAARIMGIVMETHRVPVESSIDIPKRLGELGFEVRVEQNGGYVYARQMA